MDVLSQTFLTVLLYLLSTALIQNTSSSTASGSTPSSGDKIPQWDLEKDGIYCILLQMQTQIYFSNLNLSNSIEKFNFVFLNNNTNLNMNMSSCYGPSKLMIDFEDQVIGTKVYTLSGSLAFTFQNQSTSSYNLESMELTFSVDTQKFDITHNMSIKVKKGQAYQCLSEDKRKFSGQVTIDLQQFQFEAFRNSTNTTYNKFDVCPKHVDNISDVVPIAVGCALAGLVIIVLVIYLIGRRNRQRGYESV